MTIKQMLNICKFAGVLQCEVDVRLAPGRRGQQNGDNRTKVGGPWDGQSGKSNIRHRDRYRISLSDVEDKEGMVIVAEEAEPASAMVPSNHPTFQV